MPKPEDCKRYEGCNCNICPLDPDWRRRVHLAGEPVCLWLRERSKAGWEPRLTEALPTEQLEAVSALWLAITQAAYPLDKGLGIVSRVLRRAALGGSKLESGKARMTKLRRASG